MSIKIVNSYIVKIENNYLKGVVKYKYFEQIIPEEYKTLKQQISYSIFERFEIELDNSNQNDPKLKRNIEEYNKYDRILQEECMRYFNRLEKNPTTLIEMNEDIIQTDPSYVEGIAENVWNGRL